MYLCLMKRKIETRCPTLEIQPFPESKFFHLNFDFHFDLMQLIEFLSQSFPCNYFFRSVQHPIYILNVEFI